MNPEDGHSLQEISSDTNLTADESADNPVATDGYKLHKSPDQTGAARAVPLPPGYYPVRRKGPRGLGVVICNISFSLPLRERKAAAADRDNLCLLFERMGLKVCCHVDQTGAQMRATFLEYSRRDHAGHDCFLLAASSHGDRGQLLGTDGGRVEIESSLLAPFNGANCASLRGKPKVFFIQACRGAEKDFCVRIPESQTDSPGNGAGAEKGQSLLELILGFFHSPVPQEPPLIPSELDFFIGYSTVPGYVAWRSGVKGSWFLYALCECYLAYGSEVHLTELMTYVIDYVARFFSDTDLKTRQVAKQVVCYESRLSKLLKIPLQSSY